MMLFDSHCHLTDAAFATDLAETLARARAAGIVGMVTIASDLDDAVTAQNYAVRHPGLWCTAGIHPHAAAQADGNAGPRLRDRLAAPRVVALGETGLDYHYDHSPRDVQRRIFELQLGVAEDLGLPVVVHSRDADQDMAAMIREHQGRVIGVLHCFTGGAALLETGLEANWYVSFSGLITFRNYTDTALLQLVPDDRLMLETDSPYLAPMPMRGKRNEPSFLPNLCATAARMRGIDAESLGALTARNAFTFYRIQRRENGYG